MIMFAKIAVTILTIVTACGMIYLTWHATTKQEAAEQAAAAPPAYPKCVPPMVTMGMTKDALLAACGPPSSVSHQILNGGAVDQEQWAYNDTGSYIYLSNGIVDSMQYAENGERFSWKN